MTLADRAAAAALAAGPSGAQSRGAAGASVSPAGRPAAPLGRAALPTPYCPSYPDRVPFRGMPRRLRASGEAFPAPYSPAAGEAWVVFQRSKVRRSGSPGKSRGCSIPPACSPERAAAAVPAVFAALVPRSPFSSFRSQSLPDGGFWSLLRGGEPQSRLVGSCDVCGRSGELFFTGGGELDRRGFAEGPPVEEWQWCPAPLNRGVSALQSALPLPLCLERGRKRVCLCSVKTFCCPGERVWWEER